MALNRAARHTITLFHKQDGRCFYCDNEMYLRGDVTRKYFVKHRGQRATFDHIKVKSAGGSGGLKNGVAACFKCNNMRGNLPQDVFIKNFELIYNAWDKRNNHVIYNKGVISVAESKNRTRMEKSRKHRAAGFRKGGFILARYAMQIGKTVEDLFLENVYNSTYNMVRDL